MVKGTGISLCGCSSCLTLAEVRAQRMNRHGMAVGVVHPQLLGLSLLKVPQASHLDASACIRLTQDRESSTNKRLWALPSTWTWASKRDPSSHLSSVMGASDNSIQLVDKMK